jgi:hypothetical protein
MMTVKQILLNTNKYVLSGLIERRHLNDADVDKGEQFKLKTAGMRDDEHLGKIQITTSQMKTTEEVIDEK